MFEKDSKCCGTIWNDEMNAIL